MSVSSPSAEQGRGTGWVVAQFALMAAIAGSWLLPPRPPGWLVAVGLCLAAAGAGFAGWAFRTLGRSLTPFPEPRREGTLVEAGPFALVRHPIYGGGLAFFAGLSLALGPAGLAATALLGLLWLAKSREEERRLARRFPGYEAYRRRVRRRLLPGLL
jgi:protein-S-isoprenylcysteine O-methyltransferase Ste14